MDPARRSKVTIKGSMRCLGVYVNRFRQRGLFQTSPQLPNRFISGEGSYGGQHRDFAEVHLSGVGRISYGGT
jgi:hypothetical protein